LKFDLCMEMLFLWYSHEVVRENNFIYDLNIG